MRPPFPYYGGKQRIASKIVERLPAHGHYVEPFFGGGSVLLAKEPSRLETINDVDGRIVNFWQQLRDAPDELARLLHLTPHSREELEMAFEHSQLPLEDARRVFVLLTQGRGARLTGTGWRYILDPDSTMSFNAYISGYLKRIQPAAERLMNASIECKHAFEVITSYGAREGTCLYVDPPYLSATRNSKSVYRYEADSPEFHSDLLEHLLASKASVVLSGYDSELYNEALVGWEKHTLAAKTATGPKTEVLWIRRSA